MKIPFTHHISLSKIDPLGGGLREEIIAEQTEQNAISLEDGVDEGALSAYWQNVEKDLKKDPTWFRFDNE